MNFFTTCSLFECSQNTTQGFPRPWRGICGRLGSNAGCRMLKSPERKSPPLTWFNWIDGGKQLQKWKSKSKISHTFKLVYSLSAQPALRTSESVLSQARWQACPLSEQETRLGCRWRHWRHLRCLPESRKRPDQNACPGQDSVLHAIQRMRSPFLFQLHCSELPLSNFQKVCSWMLLQSSAHNTSLCKKLDIRTWKENTWVCWHPPEYFLTRNIFLSNSTTPQHGFFNSWFWEARQRVVPEGAE